MQLLLATLRVWDICWATIITSIGLNTDFSRQVLTLLIQVLRRTIEKLTTLDKWMALIKYIFRLIEEHACTPSPSAQSSHYNSCLSPSNSPSPLLQSYQLSRYPQDYPSGDPQEMIPASQVLPQALPKAGEMWTTANAMESPYGDYRYDNR